MLPHEFARQAADRAARTPMKLGQAPAQLARLATAEPDETPYEVVYEESPVRLRRYEPRGGSVRDAPVVIAYAFINDPSILDFAPDRSVIRGFCERGFPVYVVDWGDASPIDRSLGLGDYVVRYLRNCVDVAREETGAEAVHLLGYSTGAPLSAGYAGVFPETVRTLLLQGPPLAFGDGDTDGEPDTERSVDEVDGMDLFRTLAAEHDPGLVAETFDTVPTPLLELVLALRKPVEYAVTNPLRLWDRLDDDATVEEYGRKLDWVRGGPALPATAYREFVEDLLLENRLLEGEWELLGHAVDLDRIEMPVALVIGRDDAFVPRSASVPFLDAIPSAETRIFESPVGHVGLSVSREAHADAWPRVHEWVAARERAGFELTE
ncbi:alpha/beta fold hydrolase [Natrinema salifodinae]|uniref:Polyhydroxyalkanoate synthase n=1 Tax=Natrinema salifodinae TaxID=1202768 RepID=A0A1I0MFN0_9EURY|nr:alpha/beta fold hydrolase [Natrinema salifodinae]SEV87092.1 polyhydroxyalkanoate synthase [Natrinema salifodinae]